MTSVSELLARYKPSERRVRVLLDGTISAQIDDVTQRLKDAKKAEQRNDPGLRSKVPALEAELADLETKAESEAVTFTVRSMPGGDYDALELRFPPTESQWAKFKSVAEVSPMFATPPRVDADAMAPALVAACLAEVDGEPIGWSESEAKQLWDRLHEGARSDLLEAVYQVNNRRTGRPLYESDSAATPSSPDESPTPPDTESPTASSADESPKRRKWSG
jgi:hypothetical protein